MRGIFASGGMISLLILAAMLMPSVSADTGEQYSLDCITNAYGMVIYCEPVEPEPVAEANVTPEAPVEEAPEPEPEEEGYCEAYWTCTDWSECFNGIRVRGCTINECVEQWDMPHTTEACEMPPEPVKEPVATEPVIGPETIDEVDVTVPEASVTAPEEADITEPAVTEPDLTENVTEPANETRLEEANETVWETANVTVPETVPEANVTAPGESNETETVSCTPNERKCEGHGVAVCSGSGDYWVVMEQCEEVCLNGECVSSGGKESVHLTANPVDAGEEEVVYTEYSITGMATGIDTMFIGTMLFMVMLVSGLAYFFSRSRI